MSIRRQRIANRNYVALMTQMATGVPAVIEEQPPKVKRTTPKRQPESHVGKANREWAATKGGVLRKNPRGLAGYLPPGMPVGLGFPLILDEVGYLPVTISPSMVGRTVAIACFIEDKTRTGVVAEHQQAAIDALRDAGAIAGVSRGVEDSEDIYQRWLRKQEGV